MNMKPTRQYKAPFLSESVFGSCSAPRTHSDETSVRAESPRRPNAFRMSHLTTRMLIQRGLTMVPNHRLSVTHAPPLAVALLRTTPHAVAKRNT